MNTTVIVLQGGAGTGKSSTILHAAYLFFGKKNVSKDFFDEQNAKGDKSFTHCGKVGDRIQRFTVGDCAVGFSSAGDTEPAVKEGLEKLQGQNCHIIVCACRPDGRTVDIIDDRCRENTWTQFRIMHPMLLDYNNKEKLSSCERRGWDDYEIEQRNADVASFICRKIDSELRLRQR